jgi:23S rRNA (uracil1939-C5)-methyltransferase
MVRDTTALVQNGYKLKNIGVIDMFPHTAHIETMALFEK